MSVTRKSGQPLALLFAACVAAGLLGGALAGSLALTQTSKPCNSLNIQRCRLSSINVAFGDSDIECAIYHRFIGKSVDQVWTQGNFLFSFNEINLSNGGRSRHLGSVSRLFGVGEQSLSVSAASSHLIQSSIHDDCSRNADSDRQKREKCNDPRRNSIDPRRLIDGILMIAIGSSVLLILAIFVNRIADPILFYATFFGGFLCGGVVIVQGGVLFLTGVWFL